jgi:signal transduction histidine kinase
LWQPELIWTHVVSDAAIGGAYFSIPIFLGYLAHKRPDVSFGWVVWCFAAFILACGTTHFFAIWTLWNPDYGIEALVKLVTAVISIVTAVLLWPLLPRALAWPSPQQLSAANRTLELTIGERDAALSSLQKQIAEREKTEDMLRQAQKMEAVGQLTGGIAHDFNNLLTAILMNLDRLGGAIGADGEVKARRALENATFASQRAAALTARMLAFARQQPFHVETFDVNNVIEDLEPLMKNATRGRAELVLNLGQGLLTVAADRNQFENALLNLIVNASDAIESGGTITVSTWLSVHGKVSIEVADTGSGMSEAVQAHAFEPFFTTKPIGQGSGLGLSQVYGFVKQSGGDSRISSKLGDGTKIQLDLPVSVTLSAAAVN